LIWLKNKRAQIIFFFTLWARYLGYLIFKKIK
jgi:hypothetical protein